MFTTYISTIQYIWRHVWRHVYTIFEDMFNFFSILRHVNCQNPNVTSTQPLGLTWKWLYNSPTPPPIQTQYQHYLSCYWPDSYQTLKIVFLGQSLDANFQGDISPYQQYLSYYCPDCDQNFWTKFFGGLIFVLHIFLDQTSFDPKKFSS